MPHDCRAVANAILDIADQRGLPLTHMAVHKIMFYAHGWYMAATGEPLVKQPFEAWQAGPVQRLVWDCFKGFRDKPVTKRATQFDLVNRTTSVVLPQLPPDAEELLHSVVNGYGHIDARELSQMTHEPGGPWDQVWNAPNGRVTLGMVINNESIRDHFCSARGSARTS